MKTHHFTDHGSEIFDASGASHWPDSLMLRLQRQTAWQLVRTLLEQLEQHDEPVQTHIYGQLETDVKEGAVYEEGITRHGGASTR